jgi:hypothetical protein
MAATAHISAHTATLQEIHPDYSANSALDERRLLPI